MYRIPPDLSDTASDLCNLIPKTKTYRRRSLGLGLPDMMADVEAEGNVPERKISHGIGGAGNFRRPSEAMFPPKDANPERRRSSVWSKITTPSPGSSPADRRGSFFGFFRRISPLEAEAETEAGPAEQLHGEEIQFKKVGIGARRERAGGESDD